MTGLQASLLDLEKTLRPAPTPPVPTLYVALDDCDAGPCHAVLPALSPSPNSSSPHMLIIMIIITHMSVIIPSTLIILIIINILIIVITLTLVSAFVISCAHHCRSCPRWSSASWSAAPALPLLHLLTTCCNTCCRFGQPVVVVAVVVCAISASTVALCCHP